MYRWANSGDFDALGQVMFDAIHRGDIPYSPQERQAWAPVVPSGAAWHARLAAQDVVLYQGAAGPLGFMSLRADGYVDFAYLRAEARGQGHFRALFERIVQRAGEKGLYRLTTHASLRAQGPFAAIGFGVVQHEVIAQNKAYIRRAEMALDLPAREDKRMI